MAAGIIGRKSAKKTSGGSSGSSSSSRGTSEERRFARMDKGAVAAAGAARKESNAKRLSGASSAVQSAVKNANARAVTNIAEDATNQARRANKASSGGSSGSSSNGGGKIDQGSVDLMNRIRKEQGLPPLRPDGTGLSRGQMIGPTTIDPATHEIKDKSGKVIGKGTSIADALAKQTQMVTGSAPNVAGRPDLYAVAPGANQEVKSYVDEATGKTVTPKVATPEQIQQANDGTLESYDSMLAKVDEPVSAAAAEETVPEAAVEEAPAPIETLETAQEDASTAQSDTLAVGADAIGTEAALGTKVLNEADLAAYRLAGAVDGVDMVLSDGSIYLKPGVTMQSLWDRKIPYKSGLSETQRTGISDLISKGGHGINGTFNETDAKNFAYATGQLAWQKFENKSGSEALQAMQMPYLAKAVDSSQSMEDQINGSASDLYNATTPNESTSDMYTRESAKTEDVASEEGIDLGISWMEDKFVQAYGDVNQADIAAVNDALKANQAKLDDYQEMEDEMVADIRKEVSGEAPDSYIQALALSRISEFAPARARLQAERTALTTQQSEMKQTAKDYFAMEMQNRTTALTSLDGFMAKGITFDDMSSSSIASMDKMYGEGFAKTYMASGVKKDAKAQAAATWQIYSDNQLWDKMSEPARLAMEVNLGLPAGTISSIAARQSNEFDYKYTAGTGNSINELVTDKWTGKKISYTTYGNPNSGNKSTTPSDIETVTPSVTREEYAAQFVADYQAAELDAPSEEAIDYAYAKEYPTTRRTDASIIKSLGKKEIGQMLGMGLNSANVDDIAEYYRRIGEEDDGDAPTNYDFLQDENTVTIPIGE